MTSPAEQRREPAPELEGWLAQARAGSREALGRAMEECRPYLLYVAHRWLPADFRTGESASDLVQQTLLRACQGFAAFPGRTGPEWTAWLRRILRNLVTNSIRDSLARCRDRRLEVRFDTREAEHPQATESGSPVEQAIVQERCAALRVALARLSDPHRRVLCLRTLEGLTFAEAGARLGRSADATRQLWKRAVEQLAILLQPPD